MLLGGLAGLCNACASEPADAAGEACPEAAVVVRRNEAEAVLAEQRAAADLPAVPRHPFGQGPQGAGLGADDELSGSLPSCLPVPRP